MSKVTEQKVDAPSKTLHEDENPPQVEEQTEEERTYMALAAIYKNDTDCKAPPLEGWTSEQMSVTDWFDRIRKHNEIYALARWLKSAVPDRLAEIQGDINLSRIKRNLRQCEGPILGFEELEKTTLANHKQINMTNKS